MNIGGCYKRYDFKRSAYGQPMAPTISSSNGLEGSFADYFMWIPLIHPKNDLTMWVLGSGYGAWVRPAFEASGKVQSTVGVDLDLKAIEDTRLRFASYPLDLYHCDALSFLESRIALHEPCDVVVVDLFDGEGHVPYTFSPRFIHTLQTVLNKNGLIAINIFGVPCDLMYGSRLGSYHQMRSLLCSLGLHFKEILTRRNILFLIHEKEVLFYSMKEPSHLTEAESFWGKACFAQLQLRHKRPVQGSFDTQSFCFASIQRTLTLYNEHLAKHYPLPFPSQLNRCFGIELTFDLTHPDLNSLFYLYLGAHWSQRDHVPDLIEIIADHSAVLDPTSRVLYALPQISSCLLRTRDEEIGLRKDLSDILQRLRT